MMRSLLAYALLFVAVAPLHAEELDPATVPKKAKWVVHVDHDVLTDTELMKRVRDSQSEVIEKVRGWLQAECGIDPQQDLHGITMYSDSYEAHSGAAVVFADFDKEKLTDQFAAKKGGTKSEWQGHTVFTWDVQQNSAANDSKYRTNENETTKSDSEKSVDANHVSNETTRVPPVTTNPAQAQRPNEKTAERSVSKGSDPHQSKSKMVTAILVDEKKLVVAPNKEQAQSAVECLSGKGESLKGGDSKLVNDIPKNAFFYGAAVELAKLEQHEGMFPILRQHEHVSWAIGEENGKLFEKIELVAKNDSVAEKMKSGIEGINALVRVWADGAQALNEIYNEVEVKQNGNTVNVEWEGDVEKLVAAMGEVKERFGYMKKSEQ